MSTAGFWEEPEEEPRKPSLIRQFRSKPRTVSMICWDGSGEAADLIARYGGQHCRRVPLCRDGNRLEIWWKRSSRYFWLERGDWAAIDPDGGVYPVRAFEHGDLFEAVAEPAPVSLWDDDKAWETSQRSEGWLP